jgi:hypothetical protein
VSVAGSRPRRRLRRAALALILGAAALLGLSVGATGPGHSASPPTKAGASGSAAMGEGSRGAAEDGPEESRRVDGSDGLDGPRGPTAEPALPPRSGRPRSPGVVVMVASWGDGPAQLGRRRADESNPEAPMAIIPAPGGFAVLDQVHARVMRFDDAGGLVATVPIGPDTAQDLALDAAGQLAVLDRLGTGELTVYAPDGAPLGTVPLRGGPITEPGGVTGVFAGPSGFYLEREHTEVVRVTDSEGRADPERGTQPGRPTRRGGLWLAARLVRPTQGVAEASAWDHDGQVVWRRGLVFGADTRHLVLLDSDTQGHVYLAAAVSADLVVVRLDQERGTLTGRQVLPGPETADEVFRELAVTDDGDLLHLRATAAGVVVTRYRFP